MITKVTLRLRFLDDNSPTLILKTTVPFSTSTKAFFSSFGNKKNVKTGMRGGGGGVGEGRQIPPLPHPLGSNSHSYVCMWKDTLKQCVLTRDTKRGKS